MKNHRFLLLFLNVYDEDLLQRKQLVQTQGFNKRFSLKLVDAITFSSRSASVSVHSSSLMCLCVSAG